MAIDYTAVRLALRAQLLTLSAVLPAQRAYENVAFTPTTGQPYLEEDFVPGSVALLGLVSGGTVETTGLYVVKWYGVQNTGTNAIESGVTAILNAFPPGSTLPLPSGEVVRVRGDHAPYRGQALSLDTGWTCVPVTIPWRVYSLAT